MTVCTHQDMIRLTELPPGQALVCQDCVKIGGTWVHLRLCLTCGHVGCCESSEHQHALKHFQAESHPLIRSVEPGEHWRWCYIDQVYLE